MSPLSEVESGWDSLVYGVTFLGRCGRMWVAVEVAVAVVAVAMICIKGFDRV